MKKSIIGVMTLCFCLILSCCGNVRNPDRTNSDVETEIVNPVTESDTQTISSTEKPTEMSYSKLQKVFLNIDFDTTAEDIEQVISETGLEYSNNKYNGYTVYKLACTSGVAAQKYADEGENIEITFDSKDGTLMLAEYENYDDFIISLLYNYGTHWDFRYDEPQNQYSGYYYYKPGDSAQEGIVLKYDNGREKQTNYIRCNSAVEALQHQIYSCSE